MDYIDIQNRITNPIIPFPHRLKMSISFSCNIILIIRNIRFPRKIIMIAILKTNIYYQSFFNIHKKLNHDCKLFIGTLCKRNYFYIYYFSIIFLLILIKYNMLFITQDNMNVEKHEICNCTVYSTLSINKEFIMKRFNKDIFLDGTFLKFIIQQRQRYRDIVSLVPCVNPLPIFLKSDSLVECISLEQQQKRERQRKKKDQQKREQQRKRKQQQKRERQRKRTNCRKGSDCEKGSDSEKGSYR